SGFCSSFCSAFSSAFSSAGFFSASAAFSAPAAFSPPFDSPSPSFLSSFLSSFFFSSSGMSHSTAESTSRPRSSYHQPETVPVSVCREAARVLRVLLPAAREVLVDARVERRVLGHELVLVRIAALGPEHVHAALALGAIGLDQRARLGRVFLPLAVRVLDAQPG